MLFSCREFYERIVYPRHQGGGESWFPPLCRWPTFLKGPCVHGNEPFRYRCI